MPNASVSPSSGSPATPVGDLWSHRIGQQFLAGLADEVTLAPGVARPELAVLAPFTGEEIGAVPECSEEDVREAARVARRAQESWARTPPGQRKTIVLRFHDLILRRQEELLDLVQLETGKARLHAFDEVMDVAINCRHYAHRAAALLKPRRRKGALPLLTATWELRHPRGVIGLITPWNYPLSLAISDAVPALLAGNAVLLKPAEQTPFTALLAARWLREAGLPDGLFQVVTGRGESLGAPLLSVVDFLGFTGSTETGRIVAGGAGANLIPCSLELGGKNPSLVMNDADLRSAVEGVVRGSFTNAGQLCISFERLYVQSGIYDRFVGALAERTRALRVGASFDYNQEIGSLISHEHFVKVQGHVRDAVEKGATILAGGRARPDLGPLFFEPTLLSGVTREMILSREETFGPVLAVYRFDHEEEGIAAANDSKYGLNAAIWTRDTRRARAIARRIRCGTVNINEAFAATWASTDAPMGGMKASGVGRRHGAEGLWKYTESQTVSQQRLLPVAPPSGMSAGRFAQVMTRMLLLLRHIPGLR